MGGQGDLLRIVKEVEIWPQEQMVYAQPWIHSGKWDTETLLGFWNTNGSHNFSQMTRLNNSKKKRTCLIIDFAVSANHRVNLKESKKKDKYLDIVRALKNCET